MLFVFVCLFVFLFCFVFCFFRVRLFDRAWLPSCPVLCLRSLVLAFVLVALAPPPLRWWSLRSCQASCLGVVSCTSPLWWGQCLVATCFRCFSAVPRVFYSLLQYPSCMPPRCLRGVSVLGRPCIPPRTSRLAPCSCLVAMCPVIFPRFACLFCSLFLASIAFVSLSLLSSIYWCLCGAFYGSRAFPCWFLLLVRGHCVRVCCCGRSCFCLSPDLVRLHPWMCSCGQFARPSSLPVLASRCLRTSLRLRRLTWLRPVHLSSARLAPSSGYVPLFYPRCSIRPRVPSPCGRDSLTTSASFIVRCLASVPRGVHTLVSASTSRWSRILGSFSSRLSPCTLLSW